MEWFSLKCSHSPGNYRPGLWLHSSCNQAGKFQISLLSVKFLYYLGHFDNNITVAKNYPGSTDHRIGPIGGYVLRKCLSFVVKMERHHNSTKLNDKQSVLYRLTLYNGIYDRTIFLKLFHCFQFCKSCVATLRNVLVYFPLTLVILNYPKNVHSNLFNVSPRAIYNNQKYSLFKF